MDQKKKKKYIATGLTALGVLVAALLAGWLIFRNTRPSFALSTQKVTLELGSGNFSPEDYLEDLKYASSADIAVSGQVDLSKTGTYPVTYTLGKESQTLTVTVQDTVAPALELKTQEVTIVEGETLDPESLASASDLSETTLSLELGGEDLSKPGDHIVTVLCRDASGNETREPLTVHVTSKDQKPPVLSGVKDVTITQGDSFDPMAGISAADDFDGAPSITVEGTVDPSTAGTYTLTYTATDAAGNVCDPVKRTVTVSAVVVPVYYAPEGGQTSWDARGIEGQPYLVCVNRAMCTITVYGKDGNGNYTVPTKAFVCSVAREGCTTPLGRYNTTDRYNWCYMVDGSYGRYAIRIINGIMFHSVCYLSMDIDNLEYWEYNKLGSPASLGCIRLTVADEKWLYDNCPRGFPVEIYDDPTLDGPLGKPEPIRIDENNEVLRGWDPTDWDPENPWND